LIFFLLVNIAEYFGHFDTGIRTAIFYAYILANAIVIARYIVVPLLKLFKLGKVISHDEAAEIIGKHFSDVSDKLLNALQLKRLLEEERKESDLLLASIDQKISKLNPVPFQSAIDLSLNKKYLKYPVIPVILIGLILVISPGMITEPANRLVNHGSEFEKPLPYQILIMNDDLSVVQHDDFFLEIYIEGEEVPEFVYLQTGQNRIKCVKESPVRFQHRFVNVQNNTKFTLVAGQYKTKEYDLTVLPKPLILDFEVSVEYPEYTGRVDEVIKNSGDLSVPTGSNIGWHFLTKNTNSITMDFDGKVETLQTVGQSAFKYTEQFFDNVTYSIISENEYLKGLDSLIYDISVIPDLYPTVIAEEHRDSVFDKRLYFKGNIKDDYGFNLLTFKMYGENGYLMNSDTVPINPNISSQQYFHSIDLAEYQIDEGQRVTYYFEVWDNDRINGSKSSKSQVLSYTLPSLEDIKKHKEDENEKIKEEFENAIDEVQKMQEEVDRITKKLVDKKELNWEDKEQIKQLLEKQNELQNSFDKLKKSNEQKSLKEQQYREVNEEILDKQKKLEELFEQLMENEELKKLFKELEELLEEVNKDKIQEKLDDMKLSNEELEKMLDRNLELFKQLEFEEKLNETIEKLNELAEEQKQAGEETLNKDKSEEEKLNEQKEIAEKFEDLKKDMGKLDEMNKELEDPAEFDKMEEEQEAIDEEMDESMEQLEKNNRKKASESQKNAGQKMKEMAESLFQMQQEMISEGMVEDLDALRDILENLIQLSFDQETLIDQVKEINRIDPQYTSLVQEQKKIKDDLEIVEDSLFALSKRQIMIEPFVNKEISEINKNIERSIKSLNDHRPEQAAGRQQFVLTSINNLALMLSESLEQMMSAMSMPSNSSCKNPGMKKPGMSQPGPGKNAMKSLRKMQEELNKQIEALKKGKQKGGNEPGGNQTGKGSKMSEQLARTAAEQEYIRNELRKMSDQLEKEGQFGAAKEIKRIADDMEKTETELVNKMLTEEMLMRQKQILTRLLKSEKAELEREKEEKRESNEGKSVFLRNPEDFFKYKKVRTSEVELLQPISPSLSPFYKNKVDQYFFNFEELLER